MLKTCSLEDTIVFPFKSSFFRTERPKERDEFPSKILLGHQFLFLHVRLGFVNFIELRLAKLGAHCVEDPWSYVFLSNPSSCHWSWPLLVLSLPTWC